MKPVAPLLAALPALALAASLAAAAPATYSIDHNHTEVGFEVRHFFSKVHGRFNEFDGTITFDEKDPSAIAVNATAQAKSVWTNNTNRDADLRSPHFFAVDSFPTLSFKSTKVTPSGEHKYKVAGDLTMRGVTKPVVFDAEFLGAGAVGTEGKSWGAKAGFTATTVINRKDWNISWNQVLDNGGMMLGDDVTLILNIEANQTQASAAK
jgi:polyisoprenoid-binding protein YceI